MPRCFIALPLPLTSAEVLAVFASDSLRTHFPPHQLKPVDAVDMHATLRFFGDVTTARIEPLITGMCRIATEQSPFVCFNAELAAWPDVTKPRVLVTGLRSEGRLEALAKLFETLARDLGCVAERRRFRPHVTLGRLKPGARPVRGTLPPVPTVIFHVERVELWRSLDRPGRPRYETLASAPLSASIVA